MRFDYDYEEFNGLKWFLGFVVVMGILFIVATYVSGCTASQKVLISIGHGSVTDSSSTSKGPGNLDINIAGKDTLIIIEGK